MVTLDKYQDYYLPSNLGHLGRQLTSLANCPMVCAGCADHQPPTCVC